MLKTFTFAMASIVSLTMAEASLEPTQIIETQNTVDTEADTSAVVDLDALQGASLSHLVQSGVPLKSGDSMTFIV